MHLCVGRRVWRMVYDILSAFVNTTKLQVWYWRWELKKMRQENEVLRKRKQRWNDVAWWAPSKWQIKLLLGNYTYQVSWTVIEKIISYSKINKLSRVFVSIFFFMLSKKVQWYIRFYRWKRAVNKEYWRKLINSFCIKHNSVLMQQKPIKDFCISWPEKYNVIWYLHGKWNYNQKLEVSKTC